MALNKQSQRGHRLRRAVTGLAAAAVLLALLMGLPFVLLTVAGSPWGGLPAIGDLWTTLTTPDNGQLFLKALAVVAWGAWVVAGWYWLTFLVAVVAEVPAQLRGRRTLRIPGLRLQQRLAAALVAGVAAAIFNQSLSAAALVVPTTAPVAPAVVVVGANTDQSTTAGRAAAGAVGTRDYLQHPVERGDSLLGLSERYGVPMTELAAANHGVSQPDGRSLQPGHTRIYPGWTLRVPLTGSATRTVLTTHIVTDKGAAASAEQPMYEVRAGDWLWHIADRYLGDPQRYQEIAALNPQLAVVDGRFPDHIEATWSIILPADASDRGVRPHATGTLQVTEPGVDTPTDPGTHPSAPGTASPAVPGASAPSGRQVPSVTPSMAVSPTAGASASASAIPSANTSPSASTSPSVSAAASASASTGAIGAGQPEPTVAAADGDRANTVDVDEGAVIVGTLTGAGLLAALILGAVNRRRRRQQQHRRPGRRLPHPRGGATERTLRVAEQPADVDRLDAALRHLAAVIGERDPGHLPDIVGAWIVGGAVQIQLSGRCADPPYPWVDNGPQWTLPADVALPTVPAQVAPLPALVAIGSQPGQHLLVDLERLGTLTIRGDGERALALLRYIACELACNSWSDEVDIILAGFAPDEAELLVALNPDRITVTTSVPEAVNRLRRRLASTRATLRDFGVSDTFAARVGDVGDVWPPQALLVAAPTGPALDALVQLNTDLATAGRGAVAVAYTSTGGATAGRANVTITTDGTLHVELPALTTTATAAGLPASELAPLAEIMQKARESADEPFPPANETEAWAQGTDAAGSLLNLSVEDTSVDTSTAATTTDADLPVTSMSAPEQRAVTSVVRQRRRESDPLLDQDVAAWLDRDNTRPRISVLGPVTVEAPGAPPEQRRLFHSEIIVFLAQRGARGADRNMLEAALWPDKHVKDGSLRVAITRARKWLSDTPDGNSWLPDMGPDRTYRITDGFLLDWHLFRRLRTRGEAHGTAGVNDLRAALELVRGIPLDGADRAYAAGARNPYTWLPESDIYPAHIVSAIVDTAHQLAQIYLDAGDTGGVRWAVQRVWLADPYRGDDEPWHDLMRAEHLDGHVAQLRHLLAELMRTRDAEVPEDLQPATYDLLRTLVPDLLYPR